MRLFRSCLELPASPNLWAASSSRTSDLVASIVPSKFVACTSSRHTISVCCVRSTLTYWCFGSVICVGRYFNYYHWNIKEGLNIDLCVRKFRRVEGKRFGWVCARAGIDPTCVHVKLVPGLWNFTGARTSSNEHFYMKFAH